MTFYAIKHTPTGNFLPQLRKRRGHSHTEPTPMGQAVPRLHAKESSAKIALHYWLKGKWTEIYGQSDGYAGGREYEGNDVKPCPERRPEDMAIVKMHVREARRGRMAS